jgi:RNA polymerase sigma factor (TIGR02999 family)
MSHLPIAEDIDKRGHGARGPNGYNSRVVSQPANTTDLLLAWGRGEPDACNRLMPLVYEELRRLAGWYMRSEPPGHALQATALVNEAYLRLVQVDRIQLENRAHFFALAARVMRRLLVDAARARDNAKRGGGVRQVQIDDASMSVADSGFDLYALDEALRKLESIDARKVSVVELRFFAGLNVEETAETLQVSTDTVKRDWRFAKLWLLRELGDMKTR